MFPFMRKISLAGTVDSFDVFQKLVKEYHEPVENVIRTRLSTEVLTNPDKYSGAKEVLDEILRGSVMRLQTLIPGASIFWDDHVDMPKAYDTYPRVIVDVVDGARNLQGGGTDVTSTLVVVDEKGNMPLSIISYPFGVERIVDFDGDVYRLPNSLMEHRIGFARGIIEDYRLHPRREKRSIASLRLAERYDHFDDPRRERIDALRPEVRSYVREAGSISQMMMKVVTASCDAFITQRREPIHYFDYVAPAKIIHDLQGCVTDLDGNSIEGDAEEVNGLVVASRKRTHTMFMKALH